MLPLAFLLAAVMLTALAIGYANYRGSRRRDAAGDGVEVLFEARLDPPFLRPVVTRQAGGDLVVEAPVVHARLVRDILVLDVKSDSGPRPEGFEVAITGFEAAWLDAKAYRHHAGAGHILLGPQGEMTDRLLRRAAERHRLHLPTRAGKYVQAYELEGVVTDPAEFSVEARALLPSGETFVVAYDYAGATVRARIPAGAFAVADNYSALAVEMAA